MEQPMTPNPKRSSSKPSQDSTGTATIYPELTLDDIKAIAPINRAGGPDLHNHMPTRMVPIEESKARGWGYYFSATPCRYGHVAPRYTSNPRLCVDCQRLKTGKGTIGERTGIDNKTGKKGTGGASGVIVHVTKPEQVDAWERRFLEAYAYHKDFASACTAINIEPSKIEARLSYSGSFRTAYEALEARIGVKKVNSSEGFIWTKEKHDKIIEVYINTGDLATARDSIGVTPFEYFQEVSRNPVFGERLKEADPLAHLALEERAIQLALAGNDKLLTKVLSVKKPEYRENIKVDMNVTEKLDDRQLNARLFRLLNKLRPQSTEIAVIDVTETRTTPVIGAIGRDGPEEESEEARPVLQYTSNKG